MSAERSPGTRATTPQWCWRVIDCYKAPEDPGVYAIFLNGILTYIGSGENLHDRLGSYKIRPGYGGNWMSPWGFTISLTVKTCGSRRKFDWLSREARLIARLRPRGNARMLGRQLAEFPRFRDTNEMASAVFNELRLLQQNNGSPFPTGSVVLDQAWYRHYQPTACPEVAS